MSTLARAVPVPPSESAQLDATIEAARRSGRPVWLFVDLASLYGGHEIMVVRWIEALQRQGQVTPVLMCAKGSRLAEVGGSQLHTIAVPLAEGGRGARVLGFVQLLRLFHRLKRRLRPSLVVVAEGCIMAQRHGLFAARAMRMPTVLYVPLVSSFAEMGMPDAARLDRKVLSYYRKLPTAWLTITQHQAEELRRWTGISQPVFCLPNTVDTPSLPRQAPRSGPARVLVLGRLDPHQKGLDVLLAHLQAHPALNGRVRVSLVGEGPFSEDVEASLVADPALGDRLVVEGFQDPVSALGRHDVLLLASRFEGVPLVMLEAMAAGVPVVSTDLPGTRPYLPANCLFPFGRLDSAFDIVQALQNEPALRAEVVAHNHRAFERLASAPAFEAGVKRLTGQLHALGEAA